MTSAESIVGVIIALGVINLVSILIVQSLIYLLVIIYRYT